jgi:hypothetical protein
MSDKTPIVITPVTRKLFSLEFKRYAVCYIDLALATKRASVTVACKELCVPHFYYARWKRMLEKVDDMKKPAISLHLKPRQEVVKFILDVLADSKTYAMAFHAPSLNPESKAFKSTLTPYKKKQVVRQRRSTRKT